MNRRFSGPIGRRRAGPLLALAMSMLVTAALPAPAALAADGDEAPSTLRIGLTLEPNTSNIFQCCSNWTQVALTYDALVGRDMVGQSVPGFAESWTTSEDGLTWTFKIREGMEWSDGEPADATDAAYTINRLVGSIGTEDELANGWAYAYNISTVTEAVATDATTLVVTLTEPSVQPQSGFVPIVPEHIWKDVTNKEALSTYTADPPLVTTGPYILTEWRHGESQRLVRNDRYWGPAPAIDEIIQVFYKSADAASQALMAGEVDLIAGASLAQFETLNGTPNVVAESAPATQFMALVLNTKGTEAGATSSALADVAFRDALGYAIDGQAVADTAFQGHALPGAGIVAPMDTINYTGLPDIARHFDIEEAKRRLDAAGYVDSNGNGTREDKDGKEISLRLLVDAANSPASIAGQQLAGWFTQIGVGVTPVSLDIGALYDAVYRPDFDLYLSAHFPGYLTWDVMWYGTTGPHGWVNDEFNADYAELWRTTDDAARKALVQKMEAMFYEAAAYHVLAYTDVIQAYRTDKFTGWTAPSGKPEELQPEGVIPLPLFARLAPISAVPSASPAESGTPAESTTPATSEAPTASATPGSGSSAAGGDMLPIALVGGLAIVVIGAVLLRRRSGRDAG